MKSRKIIREVETQRVLVDAMTTRMVLKPYLLDTFVATNLHADILSDLAAALSGSLGIAPTANLNPERTFPSMFEPIHGSAFDITGKGIANPIATFWTASMMLEHLGEKESFGTHDESDRGRHREENPHPRPGRRSDDRDRHLRGVRRALKGVALRMRCCHAMHVGLSVVIGPD